MTPTTSQAVRDAREVVGVAVKLGGHYADTTASLNAFEAAVRADEEAGLVDILARAVAAISLCCDGGLSDWWDVDSYWDHTPDCPWVEGMNAVAERRGLDA